MLWKAPYPSIEMLIKNYFVFKKKEVNTLLYEGQ